MLGLFGKKSDHPMADIKSVQALLQDLPRHDALKSVQELTTWIESVREESEFRLDHQFAVLRLLDETARPFEGKLVRDYFASGNTLSPFQENRQWMALNEFYGQVLQAYLNVLARYGKDEKGSSALKPVLSLVAARGMCAVAGKLKCLAAHYAPVEPEIWAGLAEFYVHAETRQYLDEQVALYAGLGVNTSVRCEFASILVWYASCASSLNRLHVHLAERLAAYLCGYFTVSAQYEPDSRFGFDLSRPIPPVRVSAETAPKSGLRFLGVSDLQPRMGTLLKTLEKNIVPEEINLGGAYEADTVCEVLRHLAECLASPPPMRRNVRRNVRVSLSVANGFAKVAELIHANLDSRVIWEAEDISANGFRCVLPAGRTETTEIGALVGIKPEKLERWGVGIVRRLSCDAQDNLHVGVEVLSNHVTGVGLRERNADDERPALWLNNSGGEAGEVSILMSPDAFSVGRSLKARMGGKNYLLMPLELVEKGADYDLVRYRKIEEDDGADETY